MLKPPPYVENIKPYIPGKPVKELERDLGIREAVKLASNENPLGPPPLALEELKHHIKDINRYPDGSGYYLLEKLSEKHDVHRDELILGNGSNELINIVVRTFMSPDDDSIMGLPSFIVYPMAVKGLGAKATEVPLTEYRHDLQAMADAITERTKIIFIANPNNPTGTIVTDDEFDKFMKRVPNNVLVVMDEAYYEYVTDKRYPDSMKFFRESRNILILRTFSKIYGLAGFRIGYGITTKEIARQMNKIREPFNTNSLAQAAATGALKDVDYVEKSFSLNKAGKEYMYENLKKLGIEYVKTEGNFVYTVFNKSAEAINSELLKRGFIVRPILEKTLRISIGLPEENRRLISCLEEVL